MPQPLVLTQPGTYVGKRSERLLVRVGEESTELPLFEVAELIIGTRGITVSSDAIRELVERGVAISFVDGRDQPYATLISPHLTATVATRRAQLAAYLDSRGTRLATAIVRGKLRNQARLLRLFGKYLKKTAPEGYEAIEARVAELRRAWQRLGGVDRDAPIDEARATLMGAEGAGARSYWAGVQVLLPPRLAFPGRRGRGAEDVVNCMLNYGYAVLRSHVQSALLKAGLDVHGGFLHADRSGRASLVEDVVEEFRAPIVDRAVFTLARKRGGRLALDGRGSLDQETRREVARRVIERLEAPARFRGKQHKARSIIQAQAYRVAVHLRAEKEYRPFRFSWG